jgi:ABC-type uncharacterized transport system involved in gliding motility auxiliary subunit
MNGRRDLVPSLVLGLALVCVLVFVGAYVVLAKTSIYGNIALGLGGVALLVYIFLRPREILSGVKSRQARYGGNTLLMTVIFIAILVLVNFLSTKQFKRWDLTAEKRFSLSPETVQVVKSIQTPITVLNFSTGQSGGARSAAATLLDQYRALSDKLQVETIDPQTQPALARQYGVQYDGVIVLVAGDKNITVNSPTESDITSGLIKVTRTQTPVVYFTTGHGERDLGDGADNGYGVIKAGLDRDGFDVRPLMTATTNTIPVDASVIVIAGPRVPFQPAETDLLRAYLARGGRLLVMADSSLGATRPLGDLGLGRVLGDWGIGLRDDFVLDVVSSQVTDPSMVIAAKFGASPITQKLGSNNALAFPLARSIAITPTASANVSSISLVQTSDQSWGALNLDAVMNGFRTGILPGPGAQDTRGPLDLAVSATNPQSGARLVVLGSSGVAANLASRWPSNVDFFLNCVNWLAEQESQITIRPKPFDTRQLIPSVGMTIQLFGISVILLPLSVLVVGAIVWWRRR